MTRRGGGNTDHQARYNVGALEQRVYGLEQAIGGIAQQIGALSQKIDAGSKTNWPVLTGFATVLLAVVGLVGGLAYWPIREGQSDLKVATLEISKAMSAGFTEVNKTMASFAKDTAERYVTVRELDARSTRTQTDISRILQDINALENVTVPRVEQQERARSIDAQIGAVQRQIDDLKKQFGDTFSLRDALQQMQREIDRLRQERRPS